MTGTAELVIFVTDATGFAMQVYGYKHEKVLTKLLNEALFHYMRNPGWIKVIVKKHRYYACQLVTIPLLAYIKKRVPDKRLQVEAERVMANIAVNYEEKVPETWIMVNENFFTPIPSPEENKFLSQKLNNSLSKMDFIEPEQEKEALGKKKSVKPVKVKSPATSKRKGSPDADKVIERVQLGWRVRDICEEQGCSEAYVYKLIKKRNGCSAMDYRWKQWELISFMYHAEPKVTLEEIEKTCGVTRAAIYHALRKVAERDGKKNEYRERPKKLSAEDVENIKQKLENGALRKEICKEYGITRETLIRYIGRRENYRVIPEELKEAAIRLRIQGKTLQQTADILSVNLHWVKKVWREKKHSPTVIEKRLKYDNRNALTKRDREQAVNAVLKGGHTRNQIYTQYGINALTLRRYIRAAQKREAEALSRKAEDSDKNDDS
ncbi:helix-turn-helix domain-containing protein [Mixta intestinalis]|uniref:Resolvase HTH domain-containing protein n=1 Tax=Mixta intestinalis TaxID=1615494 RepID=A0A6P1Q5V1_9GAMM|nr:helix-turn-helix domain-containing protein [Mixta intestinalis]QHM74033.1 hypothetical protein C7M51_04394 [Mixta intestinalis]